MEEITTEISVYLAMLYHLIEVFKGHDDFADELSESPIPVIEEHTRTFHSEYGSPTPRVLFQRGVWSSGQKCQGVPSEKGA